ncbi:MAG TPA: bacillithiol biosynthesis deacetylase BshB1 [Candidatus Latescibacteria bacterium]|nr:bacillithiol biosynthesis deacetylase BshB1 [Candidatus Latescibacterota bacterium]
MSAYPDIPEEHLDALAIGPHRDDVELSCGATLVKLRKRGYRVGIADLTAGEMGTRGTAKERAEEARCAARALGITYRVNLGLPDARIEPDAHTMNALIRLIRATRPTLVLAPHPEEGRHPDHGAAGRLVPDAVFRAGLAKWETGQPHHRPLRVIHYMMHSLFLPTFVVDVTEEWDAKMAAIRCYASQLNVPGANPGGEPTYISSPHFLGTIEARGRYYGAQIAATYGEAFYQRELMRVEDPMSLALGSVERFAQKNA